MRLVIYDWVYKMIAKRVDVLKSCLFCKMFAINLFIVFRYVNIDHTFPSRSQMPVVFYHTVIHGLEFFTFKTIVIWHLEIEYNFLVLS